MDKNENPFNRKSYCKEISGHEQKTFPFYDFFSASQL